MRRACNVAHIDAVQIEYSPFVLDVEGPAGTDLLATARELGVAIVAYSPLGRGILTGTLNTRESLTTDGDVRTSFYPMYSEENFDSNVKLVEKLKALANRKKCTLAQLAIAWLLKQGDDIIPIPGTKRIPYLEENWGSLGVQLTDAEEAEMRNMIKDIGVAGDRKPEWASHSCFIDTRAE